MGIVYQNSSSYSIFEPSSSSSDHIGKSKKKASREVGSVNLHKRRHQPAAVSCEEKVKPLTRKSQFILQSLGFILKKKKK